MLQPHRIADFQIRHTHRISYPRPSPCARGFSVAAAGPLASIYVILLPCLPRTHKSKRIVEFDSSLSALACGDPSKSVQNRPYRIARDNHQTQFYATLIYRMPVVENEVCTLFFLIRKLDGHDNEMCHPHITTTRHDIAFRLYYVDVCWCDEMTDHHTYNIICIDEDFWFCAHQNINSHGLDARLIVAPAAYCSRLCKLSW